MWPTTTRLSYQTFTTATSFSFSFSSFGFGRPKPTVKSGTRSAADAERAAGPPFAASGAASARSELENFVSAWAAATGSIPVLSRPSEKRIAPARSCPWNSSPTGRERGPGSCPSRSPSPCWPGPRLQVRQAGRELEDADLRLLVQFLEDSPTTGSPRSPGGAAISRTPSPSGPCCPTYRGGRRRGA